VWSFTSTTISPKHCGCPCVGQVRILHTKIQEFHGPAGIVYSSNSECLFLPEEALKLGEAEKELNETNTKEEKLE
jgi:hypothetical protein